MLFFFNISPLHGRPLTKDRRNLPLREGKLVSQTGREARLLRGEVSRRQIETAVGLDGGEARLAIGVGSDGGAEAVDLGVVVKLEPAAN